MRARRSRRVVEHHGSDEEESSDGQDRVKDSSSADEHFTEVKLKRNKRSRGSRSSQPSSVANADASCGENDSEVNRELLGATAGLVGGSEILGWGKGGMRSNIRQGGLNGASGKLSRSNRLPKLIDRLQRLDENDEVVILLSILAFELSNSFHMIYLVCLISLQI